MKKLLSIILLIVTLLSVVSITVLADDNAQSGSGDTQGMATGYAWYNTYQFLWKVTLFVGKNDQVSKQSSLTNDFHRIGTVIMKKTGWDVPSSVKFGSGTKVDYYAGASLAMDSSPKIISDYYCPAVPIACDGDINTVKSYFGSTGTLTTVLSAITEHKGTTKERLLSSLNFTIGGQSKSGWSYDYVAPNGTSNRVPWVIVYEPMVVLNLKDKVTKLAFTATEFALAEMYGWYDWNYGGGSGQNCELLPQMHLPTSVQLEESWFGYPVYAVTSNNHRWNNEDIVKGGGWGMRWLSAAVKEPTQPQIDYGCYFGTVETPTIGGYGSVEVYWMNYKSTTGTVLCELYRDSTLIWSGNKTLTAGGGIKSTFSIFYETGGTHTLTCKINYANRNQETSPNDNIATTNVTPIASTGSSGMDYGVYILNVDQPEQDSYSNVNIWWKNWTEQSGTVLCEIYQNGSLIWSGYKTFEPYGEYDNTFSVYFPGTYTRNLEARINYANVKYEVDSSDNVAVESVTPKQPIDDTYDFSVSDLSVSPSTVYQGDYCEVSFVSDNWNIDLPYENILVEVLLDGTVVKSDYVDFTPYGRNRHRYSLFLDELDSHTITVRINWKWVNYESNRYNNSTSTTVKVKPSCEFSVSNLKVTPTTCYENETVQVTFRTDSWDIYNAYDNIPVQLLYNDEVIYTEYVHYEEYGGKNHTLNINIGTVVGTNNIKARVNWDNHSSEVNPNNNETTNVQITVKPIIDLTIQTITPNSDYRTGMTVITSFRIYNNSRHDIIPDHDNTVSFEVYYYDGSSKIVIASSRWTQAVIPAYGNNLVYFKWIVPQYLSGKSVYCKAVVNSNNTIDESNNSNNTTTLIRTVASVLKSQTPDTQYEAYKPNGFTIPSPPSLSAGTATWNLWVYSNGKFTKKYYGIGISSTAPAISPDEDNPSAEYKDDQWQMKSGYGIYLNYAPELAKINGYTKPEISAYTGVQRVEASFPEFKYTKKVGNFRSTEKYGGVWVFVRNTPADQKDRLHFTPLWYPNGNYIVSVTATDVWTPAGMISAVRNSNSIKIVDSAYDDWYVGEE